MNMEGAYPESDYKDGEWRPLNQPTPTDWRNRTCGECGWEYQELCRREAFGYSQESHEPWSIGHVTVHDPACPAFVPKEVEG